jgi:hypothetical protein
MVVSRVVLSSIQLVSQLVVVVVVVVQTTVLKNVFFRVGLRELLTRSKKQEDFRKHWTRDSITGLLDILHRLEF